MRKKLLKSALGTIACVGLLAGNANALLLDFTDDSKSELFDGYQSSVSMDYGSFSVTLTSYKGDEIDGYLTFNGYESPGPFDINSKTFAGHGDGIGIKNDEISSGQMLEVAFDPAVKVKEIYFLDLFNNDSETEAARVTAYNLEDASWAFEGTPGSEESEFGKANIVFDGLENVITIELTTYDITGKTGMSDFSLAGIDVSPVPEPATMLLFGTGLAGIASLRRKMKQ